MTDEREERTADPLIELLPELANWNLRSRMIMLGALVAYAEKQYRAAGEPHGESVEGLLRWLARELAKDAAEAVVRLGLAERPRRDPPER
jgi:hypothetical protein